MSRKFGVAIAVILVITSCTKNDPKNENQSGAPVNGLWIVNEGNYGSANGSLSWFSYDSLKVYNDIYFDIKGETPGDIPQSVLLNGDTLFLAVNNSAKIEVLNVAEGIHLGTIEGIRSPRNMALTGRGSMAVTSLASDSVAIVDLATLAIQKYIDTGGTTEALLVSGDTLYVTHWAGGNSVSVISLVTDEVIKNIITGIEPCSIVSDSQGDLRVLCSGGFMGDETPSLRTIDRETLEVTVSMYFDFAYSYPGELVAGGGYLYYLDGGIYRLSDADTEISPNRTPLVEKAGRNLYRLGYDTSNGYLAVTDAVDYVQKGYIYIYSSDGNEIGMYRAGINPGKMTFVK